MEWREGPVLPEKMAGHCALRDWDVIYAVGSTDKDVLRVFMFNITDNKWTSLDGQDETEAIDEVIEAPSARLDFACAFSDCRTLVYVTGGQRDKQALTDFFTFNITK